MPAVEKSTDVEGDIDERVQRVTGKEVPARIKAPAQEPAHKPLAKQGSTEGLPVRVLEK